MTTVQKGKWKGSFAITEKDLRRLLDTVQDKIRLESGSVPSAKFSYTLKNGSQTNTDNISDIFFDDNVGSKSIAILVCEIMTLDDKYNATITFENHEHYSVTYDLLGSDRDTVLVLASEMDERIGYMRQRSMIDWVDAEKLALSIMTISLLGFILFYYIWSLNTNSDALRAQFPSADLHSIYEILLKKDDRPDRYAWLFYAPILIGTMLILFRDLITERRRSVHFLWGDYIQKYEQNRRKNDYIIYGVIATLVFGVISGLIANNILQ